MNMVSYTGKKGYTRLELFELLQLGRLLFTFFWSIFGERTLAHKWTCHIYQDSKLQGNKDICGDKRT